MPYPWTSTAVPVSACLPWTFRGSLAWPGWLLCLARHGNRQSAGRRLQACGERCSFSVQRRCKMKLPAKFLWVFNCSSCKICGNKKKLVPVLICGNVKQRWENEADGIQQPVTRHEPHALAWPTLRRMHPCICKVQQAPARVGIGSPMLGGGGWAGGSVARGGGACVRGVVWSTGSPARGSRAGNNNTAGDWELS